ncbi:MAG: potassium transporter TrkG, partial [Rhodococcus sp. (in: high G+C Gram-positive bacteria)]
MSLDVVGNLHPQQHGRAQHTTTTQYSRQRTVRNATQVESFHEERFPVDGDALIRAKRTAGFAGLDQGLLTPAAKGMSIFLMLIGGSSGSTAGGLKT